MTNVSPPIDLQMHRLESPYKLMLASFPGRLLLLSLDCICVSFELPGEVGEGLVYLLRHHTSRWTRL